MTETPKTIQEVEQIAARWGIVLTPEDYATAQAVMNERQRQLEAQYADEKRTGAAAWVDRFNRWYPKFLRALHGIGDVSIMLAQTVLVGPGVLLVLLMLLIVEQQRVYHGVALFEVHAALAAFSASALVILNLSLELLISWVEHRANWIEPPKHEFSLRIWARRVAYLFGQSTNWQARSKSPAIRFRVVLRIVTFSILTLALAGSMRSVIERTQGNWTEALRLIITESTLLELATWLGGLLFAFAAVLSAQALSQYAARKAIEIGAILASAIDDKPRAILESVGMTGAAALLARLKEHQRQRRLAATASPAEMPHHEEIIYVPSVPSVPETHEIELSPQIARAVKWLKQNPDSKLSVREMASLAEVSASTMHRACKAAKRWNGN